MAAQANFVRVEVDAIEGSDGAAAAQPPPRTRLLCVVRGLLKKIKQTVLVGDQVRVVGIDWTDGRGEAAGRAALPRRGAGIPAPAWRAAVFTHSTSQAWLPRCVRAFTSAHCLRITCACPCEPAGMVEEVLPRRSELSDPSVANVDHVVLVFAADMPPFQPAQACCAAGLPSQPSQAGSSLACWVLRWAQPRLRRARCMRLRRWVWAAVTACQNTPVPTRNCCLVAAGARSCKRRVSPAKPTYTPTPRTPTPTLLPPLLQVTRYLVSAEGAGLPVTLVINKSDLVAAEDMQRIVDQVGKKEEGRGRRVGGGSGRKGCPRAKGRRGLGGEKGYISAGAALSLHQAVCTHSPPLVGPATIRSCAYTLTAPRRRWRAGATGRSP